MRRSDRQKDRAFCLEVMDRCTHGVVAISTEEDTPYCLPLTLARAGDSLYFHCARQGRKVDLLRQNPRVCLTFVDQDDPSFEHPDNFTTYFRSVIATGTAVEVTQEEEKVAALRLLCEKTLPQSMDAFDRAVAHSLPVTAIWRIDLDEISGKAREPK